MSFPVAAPLLKWLAFMFDALQEFIWMPTKWSQNLHRSTISGKDVAELAWMNAPDVPAACVVVSNERSRNWTGLALACVMLKPSAAAGRSSVEEFVIWALPSRPTPRKVMPVEETLSVETILYVPCGK